MLLSTKKIFSNHHNIIEYTRYFKNKPYRNNFITNAFEAVKIFNFPLLYGKKDLDLILIINILTSIYKAHLVYHILNCQVINP